MKYRALAGSLIPTAEAVRRHFRDTEGAVRFRSEEAVAASSPYRPTLLAECHDKSLLAIEVNEGSYTNALDAFVLDCLNQGLPIRLFVATPTGAPPTQLVALHRRAKALGIGVVESDGRNVQRLLPALSLSLLGLRTIQTREFPRAYRAPLTKAEETFRNGDPVKGCGRVYDIIETVSRNVAIEIDRLGLWRAVPLAHIHGEAWYRTHSWANVLAYVEDRADFGALGGNKMKITKPLWSRIRGMTPHRNDSGHEPSTLAALLARDRQLRTRFEHAVDTLADLVKACPSVAK